MSLFTSITIANLIHFIQQQNKFIKLLKNFQLSKKARIAFSQINQILCFF